MTKERLSKLQRWILVNWDNPILNGHKQIMPVGKKEDPAFHNTLWIYDNFFGIKSGKPTLGGKCYAVPNKVRVVAYRSLINLEKKGILKIPYRAYRGRGPLIFTLTNEGKKLSTLLLSKTP